MTEQAKLRLVTALTILRMPLVLAFFAGAILHAEAPNPVVFNVSFASLIASAVTDFFDGWLARRFRVETRFGAHADPLMDKFFYVATFPLLVYVTAEKAVETGSAAARAHAVAILIITLFFLARDQWVTFLRSIGAMYGVSGRAHWSGKLRTAITFPLICVIYHTVEAPKPLVHEGIMYGFEAVAVAVNVVSIVHYTRHYWPYLVKSAHPKP